MKAERWGGFSGYDAWFERAKAAKKQASQAEAQAANAKATAADAHAKSRKAPAIAGLGVKAIVACSFARTFYRNAINSGLPIIECPDLYDAVQEGDEIEIDIVAGVIRYRQAVYSFPQFPDSVRELLEVGGLAEYLKTRKSS